MLHAIERSPIANIKAFSYRDFGQGKSFLDDVTNSTQQAIQHCALVDLTNLSRVGFRGADSAAYLQQLGYDLPGAPNLAVQQGNAEWVARLSKTEYLLLGTLQDFGEHVAQLEQSWQMDDRTNYLLPRQDSHAWFRLSGQYSVAVMAKLCAIDMSAQAFCSGAIAQTSVARINAIVINVSRDFPAFNILCDRASALYLWHVLVDAMTEFDGQVIGVNALI